MNQLTGSSTPGHSLRASRLDRGHSERKQEKHYFYSGRKDYAFIY